MSEDCCGVSTPSLKRRDAPRATPASSAFHTDNNVFVEEAALFQEADCGLRGEFVHTKLANTDQVAEPLGLLRFRKLQKRIQSVNLAACWRLSILRKSL